MQPLQLASQAEDQPPRSRSQQRTTQNGCVHRVHRYRSGLLLTIFVRAYYLVSRSVGCPRPRPLLRRVGLVLCCWYLSWRTEQNGWLNR